MVTVTQNKGFKYPQPLKILILVMSSRAKDYPLLERAQMRTWDSIQVPNVTTVYYLADLQTKLIDNKLYVRGKEDFTEMFTRTSIAIRYMLQFKWDYVFKTDNSAYVNKPKLVETIAALPRTNLYAGKLYHPKDKVPLNDNFMWGEGFVLSRDLAEIIAKDWGKVEMVDDVQIARILRGRTPFTEIPFYDYYVDKPPLPNVHLYRCKSEDSKSFDKEIEAFNNIHKHLTETYYGKEGCARQSGQHQEKTQEESQQKGYTRKDKTV